MSDARELALENRIARAEADAKSWRRVAEGLQGEITRLKEELAGCKEPLTEKEIIKACVDAGFEGKAFNAITYESGPYDITCATLALKKFSALISKRGIKA